MALVDIRQVVPDRLAGVAVVTIPRHEHEYRDEAVEAVAARQHPHARPLVELQDRQGEMIERVLVDLEQLVARIILQHVDQRLAGMPVGIEARTLDHGVDLAAQIRDGPRRVRIGGRGEQADDANLAGETAIGLKALEPDIVHVDAPVHARAHRGFGGEQKLRLVEEFANLRRHRHQLVAAPQHAHLALAQQAEPGLELGLELVLLGVEFVVADAQEGEIVGQQPFEERHRLGDLLRGERRRAFLEIGDDLAEVAQHGAPILHAQPDIGEHLLERRHDRAALRFVVDARDMDMDEALAQSPGRRRPLEVRALEIREPAVRIACQDEDRVNHQADVERALRQLRHDRVDQERHVVVDDLQDRNVLEPLLRDDSGRMLETNLRCAGPPDGEQRPGPLRHGRDLARLVGQKILRHRADEQPPDEGLGDVRARAELRRCGIDQCQDSLLALGLRMVVDRHSYPLGW
jgi:hypothetical protein